MKTEQLLMEITFKTTLSGGPGGQHVNKTETKVVLEWDVVSSEAVTEEEKKQIQLKLKNNINKEGVLQMNSSQTRSQHKNKRLVIENFLATIAASLVQKKKRKPTKPSKSAKLKRLKKKKIHADKKANRKRPDF